MAKSDHIYVHHDLITHHGIDCGDGTVIHYTGNINCGKVVQTSYQEFARGKTIYVEKSYPYKYSPDEIVKRAIRKLNEHKYCLFSNNCEHFANYCTTGNHHSTQVANLFG